MMPARRQGAASEPTMPTQLPRMEEVLGGAEHFTQVRASISPTRVDRSRRRRHGLPVYRLVRYGDDFVVLVILVATVMGGPVSPRSRRNSPMNCSLRPSP